MLVKFETKRAEECGKPWGNREGRKSGEGVVEIVESQINQDVMSGKTKCASLRRKMGQNVTPCTPAAGPLRLRAKPWEIATNVARFQRKCIPFSALAVWVARAAVGGFGKKAGSAGSGRGGSRPRRASRRSPRDAALLPDVPRFFPRAGQAFHAARGVANSAAWIDKSGHFAQAQAFRVRLAVLPFAAAAGRQHSFCRRGIAALWP